MARRGGWGLALGFLVAVGPAPARAGTAQVDPDFGSVDGASVPAGSTTSTSLPAGGGGGESICAPGLGAFRCLCTTGIVSAQCTGQTLPPSVAGNFQGACQSVESAVAGTPKKRKKLLRRATTQLGKVKSTVRRLATRKRITAECATDLLSALAGGRSQLDTIRTSAR